MSVFPEIQKKNWIYNGLLLIMFSSTFSRATASTAAWLATQRSLSFLSFAIDPLSVGLASTFCGMTFMRKFGAQSGIAKNVMLTHAIALLCKLVFGIALLMGFTKNIHASLVFGLLVFLLTLVGWGIGCAGIEWQRRIASLRVLSGIA